jgi:hypothetical protein
MLQLRSQKSGIEEMRRRGVEVVEVGNEPQVLLDDDYLIAATQDIEFVPARLEKCAANPVLIPDRPWEGAINLVTALHDEEEQLFKLWYSILQQGRPEKTGYAISRDGVNWEKPSLGLVEYEGSRDNNLVVDGNWPCCVYKDYSEPDPERRYKAVFNIVDFRGVGFTIGTSPDGLRWNIPRYAMLNGGEFDSQNVVVWDDQQGSFRAYVRHWLYGMRQMRLAESPNLTRWPRLRWVHGPDNADPPELDLYTPAISKYALAPNVYVMITAAYDHPTDSLSGQLALSRDGVQWKRYRHPFIPLGAPGAWDAGCLYPAPALLPLGDRLFVTYRGDNRGHVEIFEGAGIGVGTLRRDGFVALRAGAREGIVTTRPLAFSHDGYLQPHKGRLTLNIDVAGGRAQVELLDLNGVPLPGYAKDDCDPIEDDSTLRIVSWRGRRALDQLCGTPLMVRFYLTNCALYSLQFLAYGTRGRTFDDPEEQRLYDLDRSHPIL